MPKDTCGIYTFWMQEETHGGWRRSKLKRQDQYMKAMNTLSRFVNKSSSMPLRNGWLWTISSTGKRPLLACGEHSKLQICKLLMLCPNTIALLLHRSMRCLNTLSLKSKKRLKQRSLKYTSPLTAGDLSMRSWVLLILLYTLLISKVI